LLWIWKVFALDLLGKVIILVAANPYSLPSDFRKVPLKFEWPANTGRYTAHTYIFAEIEHANRRELVRCLYG